jgi:hypothetical protein
MLCINPRCNIKLLFMDQLKKLELVNEMITLSNKQCLTAECVLTAINIAKQHPSASVANILAQTLEIWDCFPKAVNVVCDDLPF